MPDGADMQIPRGEDAQLAVRYGGAVPRYTSYPTAPHFSDAVDAGTYEGWLETIGGGDDVSLYLHVPYCREMCWYCGCFTKIVQKYEPVAGYVDALLAEIDLVASRLSGRANARFIHWGGGSPTILRIEDWYRVLNRLRACFNVDADAEIAVEIDPRTMSRPYIADLAKAGVNRVSIGVQEFDADIQRAINRIQPFETTARVVDWIAEAGIENLNLDLMYGLPKQTVAHVERMTERALSFRPSRIALFGYAHVPWMKSHQRLINDDDLPGLEERWHQARHAAEQLVAAGYVRVGFDHFALPTDPLAGMNADSVGRNFQGYTTDTAENLIGLGASAISSLRRGYAQNVASIPSYMAAVNAGRLAVARGIALSDDDRLRRFVIERIMCDMGVDIGEACLRFGMAADTLDPELQRLAPMIGDGLVAMDERRVRVSEHGRALVRNVAAVFDAYLESGKARHSTAV
jgi:oxygen-independent coproporphyrinogen-3 oxidase